MVSRIQRGQDRSRRSSPESVSSPRRFEGFDGIRGLAVLAVIVFHAHLLEGPDSFTVPLLRAGWVGVDVFFVLSGFLITSILWRTKASPRYWRTFAIRRALRILPLYYLVLLAIALLPALSPPVADGPPWWAFPAFLSNFWIPTSQTSLALVVTWSLAIEEQFYVVWPLLVRWANRTRLVVACTIIVIASPIVRFLLHDPHNEIFYMWTPARIDSLAWGALAWLAWDRQATRLIDLAARTAPWGIALLAVILSIGGGDQLRFNLAFAVLGLTFLPVVVAALLLALAAARLPTYRRLLEWRPLAHLGKVSFGAYLLHGPVILALRRTSIDGDLYRGMVFAVAVTWGVAALVWHVFERPILAQKDRLAPY